jgi:hypothetical protein
MYLHTAVKQNTCHFNDELPYSCYEDNWNIAPLTLYHKQPIKRTPIIQNMIGSCDIINILPLIEGVYSRLPHEGKHITLWKKNITRDEVEGDTLFPECDIFSRVWSSTITSSTKGSMFFIILNASSKEDFEFLLSQLTNGTHYVHITT